ncbi:hypothetical protein PQO03_13655 [Lentisphaera profundi]|uniref:Uncharacterized protein n=1 Tax=Lentisphaera profundi TaxID=1658616 RepID=A0ABY7VXG5_9BACT|nr:hypothetical protein [Lentisphaera profundi]WDE98880.1 hypothetical protein PQO03_13655 [Lentisphaera profundi]
MMRFLKTLDPSKPHLLVLITLFSLSLLGDDQPSSKLNTVLKTIPVKVSQGVAVDEKYFYGISNTRISKHDKLTNKIVATWQAKGEKFKHFKHMNSGTVIDGKLYCAHSRFAVDPNDCTVEIWDVQGERLVYERSISMPRKHGSLTWIDQSPDGFWWMCYAVYGKNNHKTKLVKYRYENNKFIEIDSYFFPQQVISQWGRWSCSGGSWDADQKLYTTGHDHGRAYVLEIAKDNKLTYVRTEKDLGFYGQAIAWDRFSEKPMLWGIIKNKSISLTHIPRK